MLEFQNIKTFLLKDILQIGQKKYLLLVKLKIKFLGLFSDLNGEEITGSFYEKELHKTSQKEPRIKKVIEKVDKLYVIWKGYHKRFHSSIDKKDLVESNV